MLETFFNQTFDKTNKLLCHMVSLGYLEVFWVILRSLGVSAGLSILRENLRQYYKWYYLVLCSHLINITLN